MTATAPSPRRTALAIAALLAVVAAVYLPSLANDFVWDDVAHIVANPRLDSLPGVGHYLVALEGPYHRPLVFATYAVEVALWGRWAPAFHATNLLLHLVNVALVVLVARRTGVALSAAVGGAAVFALHPLQVEAVAYVSGRTDLLMTAAALAGTLALLGGGAAWQRGAAAAAGAAAALLAKESGYALLVVWPWLIWRHERRLVDRAALLLPTLAVAAVCLMLRPGAPALAGGGGLPARLAALGTGILAYVRLLAWPSALQVDRLTPLAPAGLAAAVAVVAVALLLIGLGRRGAVGDWSAWVAAFYLPVANLVPLYPAIAARALFTPEHNLYAPLAGLGVLAAIGVMRLAAAIPSPLARGAIVAGLATPLLAWAVASAARLPDWHDEAGLFSSALALGSESPRVWYNAGNARLAGGDFVGAARLLAGAAARAPGDAAALANLGVARQRAGDLVGAQAAYARAAALAPDDAVLWENLGTLAVQRNDADAARRAFARALALDPGRDRSRRALEALESLEGARR